MTIELNEQQLEVLKDTLLVNGRIVSEERIKWLKQGDKKLAVSCTLQLKTIREIESMIY